MPRPADRLLTKLISTMRAYLRAFSGESMWKHNAWLWPLAVMSILLHVIYLAVGTLMYFGGSFSLSRSIGLSWVQRLWCPSCDANTDVVNAAAQMGRLDLVAVSLTILATVLAFGAFAGFFLVRGAAMQAAGEEARQQIIQSLPSLISTDIIAEAILKDDRVRLSLLSALRAVESSEADVAEDTANAIAKLFDEKTNEK